MIISPSRGSLALTTLRIAKDAERGLLGKHTARTAIAHILNKKRGLAYGHIGWTWLYFIEEEDRGVTLHYDLTDITEQQSFTREQIEEDGIHSLIPENFRDFGQEDDETMVRMGLVLNQKFLIRGKGWQSGDYSDYDAGYDVELMYVEEGKMDTKEFCELIIQPWYGCYGID